MLIQTIGASERQTLTHPQPSFDPVESQPSNVPQALQADPEIEKALSAAAVRAFGEPVTLNRVAGPTLRLHVGKPERPPALIDIAYANELAALPGVHDQGDGYRAFLGVMLSLLVGRARILLVDEPEAFLHPPQARRLGREIASRPEHGTQVFCATHSSEVLEGALQAGGEVNVLRITRSGNVNRPTMLDAKTLRELRADPLLRYSGALNALFARGLVICENERDCTFYLAVLDEDPDVPSDHDLEFVTVGGKSSIPRVASAVHALGAPVSAICDIDVLNDAALLHRLVVSLGATVDEGMQRDLRVVQGAAQTLALAPTVADLQHSLTALLNANEGAVVSRNTLTALQKEVRKPSGWKRLKQDGLSPLRGEQRHAADRLIAALAARRLYVVHKGELEGWVPEAGAKSSDWLAHAFALHGHRRPEVREFVRPLTRD